MRRLALCLITLGTLTVPLRGYSVLTHEAIVDTLWNGSFKPLLLKRFPEATPDQLIEAHAYAYGGSIIQDMGYYPFGSRFFSDLLHYARSGDFVLFMLREAQDLDEYAFALGALAHYSADNLGHPIAVNRSVPILYPKLREKFGNEVTYAEDPAAHLKTEFGFDVLQIARGHYAPKSYHDFIGFQVSKPVLERAFADTYGFRMKEIFKTLDLALGTYRHTVSALIPEMTKTAWAARKKDIEKENPGITRKKFLYTLSRASYEKEWGHSYDKPGVGARFLAFVFQVIPKVGPFRALAFRAPNAQTEQLFQKSFEETVTRATADFNELKAGRLELPNRDFDTGRPAKAGEYSLADDTYNKLLDKLAGKKYDGVTSDLRANILAFYGDEKPALPKTADELRDLREMRPIAQPAGL